MEEGKRLARPAWDWGGHKETERERQKRGRETRAHHTTTCTRTRTHPTHAHARTARSFRSPHPRSERPNPARCAKLTSLRHREPEATNIQRCCPGVRHLELQHHPVAVCTLLPRPDHLNGNSIEQRVVVLQLLCCSSRRAKCSRYIVRYKDILRPFWGHVSNVPPPGGL